MYVLFYKTFVHARKDKTYLKMVAKEKELLRNERHLYVPDSVEEHWSDEFTAQPFEII